MSTKAILKLTLNEVHPTHVILQDEHWNEVRVPVEEVSANDVLNINRLATEGRIYFEHDRAYRTIGNKQEYQRSWIGHRTHDFFLEDDRVTIEYKDSQIMTFVFRNTSEAKEWYNYITERKVKPSKEDMEILFTT